MRAKTLVLMLVTFGALVPLSASASPATLLAGALPGDGYVAVKLAWTGPDPVTLQLLEGRAVGAMADGAAAIMPDGSSWSVIGVGDGLAGDDDCLIVASDQTGPVHEACSQSAAQGVIMGVVSGAPSIAMRLDPSTGDAPGTYTLVVWQAFLRGEELPGSWSLQGVAGEVTILGVTSGDSAYFAMPRDFEGGTRASASAAGVFAGAHVGSHYEIPVRHTPMAWIAPDKLTRSTPGVELVTPTDHLACECSLMKLTGSEAARPGIYDVRLDRVAVGMQGMTEAFVALVDPELPT